MLKLKNGEDILVATGKIKEISQAREVFAAKLNKENLEKIEKIKTEEALIKIANAIVIPSTMTCRKTRHGWSSRLFISSTKTTP